jgi:hypothetical protein
LVFCEEREDFVGAFLVYAHWHFWVAGFFSPKSGINETKRKSRVSSKYNASI